MKRLLLHILKFDYGIGRGLSKTGTLATCGYFESERSGQREWLEERHACTAATSREASPQLAFPNHPQVLAGIRSWPRLCLILIVNMRCVAMSRAAMLAALLLLNVVGILAQYGGWHYGGGHYGGGHYGHSGGHHSVYPGRRTRAPPASPAAPVQQTTYPTASPEEPCVPEEGVWRPGSTYNDPSQLRTATAVQCCNICRADPNCVTWSRNRRNGGCALKNSAATAFREGNYDSGVIEGTDAQSSAPLGSCFTQSGTAFPGGNVVSRSNTASANQCCEQCRSNANCFSWQRNSGNGNCVLNGNVPGSVSRGNFDGGSAI